MSITYSCTSKACKNSDGKPVTRVFKEETCMDEKNIATPFCPRCNGRMVRQGKSNCKN